MAIPASLVFLFEFTVKPTPATSCWIDSNALRWMHEWQNPFLDSIFIAATWFGSAFVLLPTCIILMAYMAIRKRRLEAWLLALGVIGAILMSQAAKTFFSRPRPELFDSLVAMPASWSFPSGHATQITAFMLCLTLIAYRFPSSALRRLISTASIVVATGVGSSRIYLQVHYLSDVLAGGMLAILWVAGLYTLLRWLETIFSSHHSLP